MTVELQLSGKRALVSGSSSGIGRAIARGLAQEGVAVVVHGRDARRAEATAESITAAGGTAAVALGDLTDDAGAAEVVAAGTAAFGGIDILVNNIGEPGDDTWNSATTADWLARYATNIGPAVRLISALTAPMRERGWGRIIQIGSAAHPNPFPIRAPYGAAKAALANLTVSLTKELAGTGITVNTVSPGPTATDGFKALALDFGRAHGLGSDLDKATRALVAGPMANPSGRMVEPHEIAALVALVASPLSASINGANLRIDGGLTPTVN